MEFTGNILMLILSRNLLQKYLELHYSRFQKIEISIKSNVISRKNRICMNMDSIQKKISI
jgi:hypothetical protein